MKKEKLLYVSPFPPQKSGISDYSEVLVNALKVYFDITLLVENYKLSNSSFYCNFEIITYKKQKVNFDEYKYIIYNIGNNPEYHSYIYELCLEHPGLVIQHDFVLYYLIIGYYESKGKLYSKLYEIGGSEAIRIVKQALNRDHKNLLEHKDIAPLLPLNRELIESGNKIMVHSHYTEEKIKALISDSSKVRKINHIKLGCESAEIIDRNILFSRFHIPSDALIIASFGYISKTKLNHLVCEAVRNICERIDKKICYIMVGEGDYVDSYVDNKIIFKTGYVELDEFNSFLKYSDIVANLRYPSMGETSGALIRIMECGKPCIIVADAWFAELPKDCLVSLEKDELHNLEREIRKLIIDEGYRKELGERASSYIEKYYSPKIICDEIIDFLKA